MGNWKGWAVILIALYFFKTWQSRYNSKTKEKDRLNSYQAKISFWLLLSHIFILYLISSVKMRLNSHDFCAVSCWKKSILDLVGANFSWFSKLMKVGRRDSEARKLRYMIWVVVSVMGCKSVVRSISVELISVLWHYNALPAWYLWHQ